jgi:hypothetical protein
MRHRYHPLAIAILLNLFGTTAAFAQNPSSRLSTRPITQGLNRQPVDASGRPMQNPNATGSVGNSINTTVGQRPIIPLNRRCGRDAQGVVRCRGS